MWGVIFSIIAGVSMSLQGAFNTRLGEKIGLWETNMLVQGIGFICTLAAVFFLGDGNFRNLKQANKLYLLGGVLGVLIIYTVMKGMSALGTTCAVSVILVAQLGAAAIIDAFGWFGCKQECFGLTKYIGVAVMVAGILIFKWKR